MNTPLPDAVVTSMSPTGLHIVRTLGRAGVRVTTLSTSRLAGTASKYAKKVVIEPDPDKHLQTLLSLYPERDDSDPQKPILIPSADIDVELIAKNATALAQHYRFQESYADGTALRIMDKDQFYKICDQQNVDYPKLIPALPSEISAKQDQFSYPVMIKPARIHAIKSFMRGQKGWVIKDADELSALLTKLSDDLGTMLIQEIVAGPEHNITLYCGHFTADGTVQQPFTARKLRQYPPGFGSASCVQSNPEDDSQAQAEKLLTALNYQGIAAAEFKRDPNTGKLKIIEINPRTSLWFSISAESGKDPILASYHALGKTGITLPETPQTNGVRWVYVLKDTASRLFYWRNPKFILPKPDVSVVGKPRKYVYPVWSMFDQKPLFAELGNLCRKFVSRLFKA